VTSEVSMKLFYSIFVMMVISNIIYFKAKNKSNYFDFDTIFILIYCLVGFSTTFFYENKIIYKSLFIGFGVSDLYINRGDLLFLIGLQCYMFGSLKVSNNISINNTMSVKTINTFFLQILVVLLIIFFILSGGITYIKSGYEYGPRRDRSEAGVSRHILLLIICTAIVIISTELYNKYILATYKIKKTVFLSIFVLILMLLWAGNRTAASQLAIPIVCIYTMFFLNVKLRHFLILVFLMIIAMWGIQRSRSSSSFNISNPISIILDLTIPARQTYTAMDYVELNGYTYGKSMSLGIIGTVPFLASKITKGDMREYSSPEILTAFTNDKFKIPLSSRIGLGTTIIADLYMSFGLIGIILLMFVLGYFINILLIKSLKANYFSLIILAGMLANTVFVVRASYTHPVRYVIWAVIIAFINRFQLFQKI